MEIATVIGVIGGAASLFVGMIMKGAPISALNNPAAFLIIIMGTITCIFTAFPMEGVKQWPTLVKKAFFKPALQSRDELVSLFIDLSQIARREGILALESKVQEIEDPFFKSGLSMVIDGMDPEFVSDVLDAELTVMQARHGEGKLLLQQAGTYAPTLGVLGAVVGLIAALASMDDIGKLGHAIASAFVATILGIYTAYCIWLPMANKLKIFSDMEINQKRMIIEGILSLQAGDSPTAIEAKLMVFIPQSERASIKTSGGEG